MSQRITDKNLDNRVSTLNSMLGLGEEPSYPTPGMIVLYKAYGSTAVHRVVNESGGQTTLFDLDTKRACYDFLGGMIAGIRALDTSTRF